MQWLYLALFRSAVSKKCTVYEVYETEAWAIQLGEIVSQEQQDQEQKLRRKLEGVIIQSQTRDQIHWNRNLHGFSVNSLYKFLQSTPAHKTHMSNI
jgi:hypothetical protein